MSGVGLDWYKRQPAAYLKDTQGLSAKEHAVYSVVLDLIYANGGDVNNDPKWISGWFSDMGAAACRGVISSLVERGILTVDGEKLTQKRAKNEAKTKRKQRETAAENGRIGGKRSAEKRGPSNENNDLGQATASSETQAEKRREEERRGEDTNVSLSVPDANAAFDDWNTFADSRGLPRVEERSASRRKVLNARLRKVGNEGWREALRRAARSDFLMGQTNHNFQLTFDFIAKAANFTKLTEGNYDPRPNNTRQQQPRGSSPHSTLHAAFGSVGGYDDGGSAEPSGDMRDVTPTSAAGLDCGPGFNTSEPFLRVIND